MYLPHNSIVIICEQYQYNSHSLERPTLVKNKWGYVYELNKLRKPVCCGKANIFIVFLQTKTIFYHNWWWHFYLIGQHKQYFIIMGLKTICLAHVQNMNSILSILTCISRSNYWVRFQRNVHNKNQYCGWKCLGKNF